MSAILFNNILLKSKHNNREFIADIRYASSNRPKPVVVFVHGLKGFKDWGHWNLIADSFAKAGFVFSKLNLSHNGTTPGQPTDFADLDAFGRNNFSIELDDVGVFLDYLFSNENIVPDSEINLNKVFIIGHSRGGGLAILKAHEDTRIKALTTWASVDDYGARWPEPELKDWKKAGVRYMYNGRTKQEMPQEYQIVEDYWNNQSRLNIKNAVSNLTIPCLFIHGANDETVTIESLINLKALNPSSEDYIVDGANHVFGGKHPYEKSDLPEHTVELVAKTINWMKNQ